MPAKISNFVSEVSKNGLAMGNRFGVDIFPPQGIQIEGSAEKASMMVDEVSMPGLLMQTRSNRIYGAPHQQAVGFSYTGESIPFTFLLDRHFEVKKFLESWMFGMFNKETNNLKYQQDYVSTIYVNQLDKADQIIYSVVLLEAFPISMQLLPVGNAQNAPHRLNVSFAFRKWIPVYTDQPDYMIQLSKFNSSFFGFRMPGFLEPEQLMKMGQVAVAGKLNLPPFFPNFR